MVPSYLVVSSLGLTNSFWALWLPGAINAFNMIIIKNYFQGIPRAGGSGESGRQLGFGDFPEKIILPLSKPTIASVSLFYAVGHWNSYFSAMLYISDKSKEVGADRPEEELSSWPAASVRTEPRLTGE